MKLKVWADKQGISYLTAYRWFKDGKLPVKAYQSDSGTIIVEEESSGQSMMNSANVTQSDDAISIFLKKTIEFSKNNVPLEDFAAYVLSNFSLKLKSATDVPRYSKNKPKPEDIQKHFQQFIPKGEKPKPNMYVADPNALNEIAEHDVQLATQMQAHDDDIPSPIVKMAAAAVADDYRTKEARDIRRIAARKLVDEIRGAQSAVVKTAAVMPASTNLYKELTQVFDNSPRSITTSKLCDQSVNLNSTPGASFTTLGSAGGMINRTELTPQNYTSSTDPAFSSLSFNEAPCSVSINSLNTDCEYMEVCDSDDIVSNVSGPTGAFKPTQKEIELATRTFSASPDARSIEPPKRRGRKSHKNIGKKE